MKLIKLNNQNWLLKCFNEFKIGIKNKYQTLKRL